MLFAIHQYESATGIDVTPHPEPFPPPPPIPLGCPAFFSRLSLTDGTPQIYINQLLRTKSCWEVHNGLNYLWMVFWWWYTGKVWLMSHYACSCNFFSQMWGLFSWPAGRAEPSTGPWGRAAAASSSDAGCPGLWLLLYLCESITVGTAFFQHDCCCRCQRPWEKVGPLLDQCILPVCSSLPWSPWVKHRPGCTCHHFKILRILSVLRIQFEDKEREVQPIKKKVLLQFQILLGVSFFFLTMPFFLGIPGALWELSSPTRNWTCVPCSGSIEF